MPRLIERVRAHAAAPAPRLGDALLADFRAFMGGAVPADDVTLVVVKIR
jgi:serine phosphatase RsbU (regulator of sigma subunit)